MIKLRAGCHEVAPPASPWLWSCSSWCILVPGCGWVQAGSLKSTRGVPDPICRSLRGFSRWNRQHSHSWQQKYIFPHFAACICSHRCSPLRAPLCAFGYMAERWNRSFLTSDQWILAIKFVSGCAHQPASDNDRSKQQSVRDIVTDMKKQGTCCIRPTKTADSNGLCKSIFSITYFRSSVKTLCRVLLDAAFTAAISPLCWQLGWNLDSRRTYNSEGQWIFHATENERIWLLSHSQMLESH